MWCPLPSGPSSAAMRRVTAEPVDQKLVNWKQPAGGIVALVEEQLSQ